MPFGSPSAPSVVWPQSFATVCQKVLPSELFCQIAADADAIAEAPNFWMPKAAILPGSRTVRTIGEQVIAQVYDHVLRSHLPCDWEGAEWWVQVYQPGKGLAFHFDKDEHMMAEQHVMVHPITSCILYLAGGSEDTRLGPTVIIDQQYDNEQGRAVPEHPARCALVYPLANQLCWFDGQLAHGVLDSPQDGLRVTMLINWWAARPQDTHRVTPADIVKVPPGDEPIMVDDLLESYGISVVGPNAVHVIAMEHQGYELYPMADENSLDGSYDRFKTAAAFVPAHMLASTGSDSEEGSEEFDPQPDQQAAEQLEVQD
ncbi:hypothetical protein WJX72_011734 [[Myrmecia] bisecta]|uniref:Fe2OG dioxygenase domain-containing protein n=1 Tax=[Myrmecia] bisecta TaxID=41462 RepID=A0AAW1PD51_9CHLO